jgi:RNA polymerase sigma-70 factor (ECF subfamily)
VARDEPACPEPDRAPNEPAGDPPGASAHETATLVARARKGDGGAFACLVERHAPALQRFCRRLMPEPGAAQDLAQETFLRAYQSLPRLADPQRFGAWVFGIAANLARWWWRRQARWPLSLDGLLEAYPDVPWALVGPAPEEVLEEAEQARRLLSAIDSLPPALARVVVLHYLDGLSYAEAAAALDVPLSTVKGRLFKSRARLRRALDPQGLLPRRPPPRRKETPTMTARTETAAPRLVPVQVERIHTVPHKAPRAVLLKEADGERRLPIIVGYSEAEAVALQLQGQSTPRPLTYDLLMRLLQLGQLHPQQVAITRLGQGDQKETFFATVTLGDREGQPQELDARPSDAINVALRAGVPILCAESLLQPADQVRAFVEKWEASPGVLPPPGSASR